MQKITYEKAMKRLEEIVKELEDGNIPLDKSLKLFEEGTKLSDFCTQSLANAEQKVIDLTKVSEGGKKDEV